MATCKNCFHFEVCDSGRHIGEYIEDDGIYSDGVEKECATFKNAADVAEVKHGRWHILPDDPYDESGVPTEEGWYRIITADGQETTDYFFNKPTMCEHGITYWKNARSKIRAWAKMDGGKEE